MLRHIGFYRSHHTGWGGPKFCTCYIGFEGLAFQDQAHRFCTLLIQGGQNGQECGLVIHAQTQDFICLIIRGGSKCLHFYIRFYGLVHAQVSGFYMTNHTGWSRFVHFLLTISFIHTSFIEYLYR